VVASFVALIGAVAAKSTEIADRLNEWSARGTTSALHAAKTVEGHKMSMFNRKNESAVPVNESTRPIMVSEQCPGPITPPQQSGGVLSKGVSIKGSVRFVSELLIDGEVDGTIDSPGKLSIGEHAHIKGEIRAKSVKVRGDVEGDIFATERCELAAGSALRGDIEAPRLVVDENATFLGSAKVAMPK
jgi:cytoskeletal protein CcmA (bactofilin family)